MRDVVIISAARTPVGSFGGKLSTLPASELGAVVIKEALKRADVKPEQVDEVIMGNVLVGGQGQAPARQAALKAGLPNTCPCVQVGKVCGSGLKSVMMGAQAIMVGDADIIVAGGMESMSMAPYFTDKARWGCRMNNVKLIDMMVHDGLWDPYNDFHMGMAAELCASEYNITRQEQDAHALESYNRSRKATEDGKFKAEIVPVTVPQRKGDPVIVDIDEEPFRSDLKKLPKLRPAFKKDGTVTAGNASSINDGAAAVVIAAGDTAEKLGLTPMAKIIGQAGAAQAPEWFTTAPAAAVKNLYDKIGWNRSDVDFFEINEAFSVVSIINNRKLELDTSNVNLWGGAVSLGHPIGASGARILTTLLYVLKDQGAKRGVAALCIGGGEAVAVAVEML